MVSVDTATTAQPAALPVDAPAHVTFRSVLGQPAVRNLWLASLISYVGDTFGTLALFLLVSRVTGSTGALGAVALVQTLPLFLGVVAGLLVDRWRYRPVLLTADLLRAVVVPCYALLFQTAQDLWLVLLLSLGFSLASRFFTPASQALRRALLRPEEYQIAASLWQTTLGLSYVLGPALAGLTIATFAGNGISIALWIDAFSFVISALLIFFGVRQAAQAVDSQRQSQVRPSPWADLQAGVRLMWASRAIRGSLVLYGFGLLGVGAIFVLTVPYVERIFHGGSLQIGLLDAAEALGLAIGAVGVGTIAARRFPAGTLMLGAALVGGVAVITLGIVPIYPLALLTMMIAGGAAGTLQSAGSAVILHTVPQQHQGKASAAQTTLLNVAYVTSIALAGIGGDTIGIRGVFVFGGIVALIGVAGATPLLWGALAPHTVTRPVDVSDVGDPAE